MSDAADLRLRQVAFAAHDLDSVAAQLAAAFDLRVGYRDPAIIHYGLRNAVLPVGGDFLEVVEPVRPDASAARYLARRGGDSGYMVIVQAADARAHRARLAAAGAPIVDVLDDAHHEATHFHPRAFDGVLASIDSAPGVADWRARDSFWHPAGDDWRAARGALVEGIAAVTIAAADPAATAARWGRMLDAAPVQDAAGWRIALLRGAAIRFASGDTPGIAALDLAAPDPQAVLARAEAAGVPVRDGAVIVCNVPVRPVPLTPR